jgi:hypothetical protein
MDQFRHGDARGNADRVVVQIGPDRIERLQPDQQLVVLHHDPGQVLVHMVMRVHHTGHDNVAGEVQDFVRSIYRRQFGGSPNGFDDVVAQEDCAVLDLAALVVEGRKKIDIFHEKRRHVRRPQRSSRK